MKAQWQQEKETLGAVGKIKQQIEQARVEAEQATRARRSREGGGDHATARSRSSSSEMKEAEAKLASARRAAAVPQGGSRRRKTSPRSSRGGPAFRSRGCWRASASGSRSSIRSSRARRRAGRGGARGGERGAPLARRTAGSESSDRLVHLPRPDRRREDGDGARARRVPVRRRARDGAHRHVGVHGEARRRAAHRRAAGLRRLRGGRPAHRSGAPPAVLGHPVRRDREGASRMCSTSCSRSSTTAGSPIRRAARWISGTPSSS